MRCKSCVAKITSECETVFGVEQVHVQLEASTGFVIHSKVVTAESLRKIFSRLSESSHLIGLEIHA